MFGKRKVKSCYTLMYGVYRFDRHTKSEVLLASFSSESAAKKWKQSKWDEAVNTYGLKYTLNIEYRIKPLKVWDR